jgi:hypothetical protein
MHTPIFQIFSHSYDITNLTAGGAMASVKAGIERPLCVSVVFICGVFLASATTKYVIYGQIE